MRSLLLVESFDFAWFNDGLPISERFLFPFVTVMLCGLIDNHNYRVSIVTHGPDKILHYVSTTQQRDCAIWYQFLFSTLCHIYIITSSYRRSSRLQLCFSSSPIVVNIAQALTSQADSTSCSRSHCWYARHSVSLRAYGFIFVLMLPHIIPNARQP
jgi:hypothetical protein